MGNDYFPHQQMVSSLLKSQSKDRREGVKFCGCTVRPTRDSPHADLVLGIVNTRHCCVVRGPFSEIYSCMINISVLHTRIQFRIYATNINMPIDPESHPTSGTNGTDPFPQGKTAGTCRPLIHPLLVSRLCMGTAVPLSPFGALMACYWVSIF